MAFRFTASDKRTISDLVGKIENARISLEDDIQDINNKLEPLIKSANNAVDTYNDVLTGAREAMVKIYEKLQEEFDNKSEKWAVSENGLVVSKWIDDIQGNVEQKLQAINFDADCLLPMLDTNEIIGESHIDALNKIPEEPKN